jgi:hypothetical protein
MYRSQDEIFDDLRALAQSQGAMHELSAIVYRDWVLTIDTDDGKVKDEPAQRWSTDKLNTNELLLLLGLMVQSPDDRTYATYEPDSDFAARADKLLREFHDRVNDDAASVFDPESQTFLETPNSLGMFAREAIYYGAQSFYLHQFAKFARERYRQDGTWLLQNVGISIRPIIDIARFFVQRVTEQMSAIGYMRREGKELTHAELTNSLLVSKKKLRKRFGGKADAFIAKFATRATAANVGFTGPFTVNVVSIAPLIDFGEYLYVPNQYRLLESVYESPFYWMISDTAYAPEASDHRGAFLEATAEHIFMQVFGASNVFVNATFPAAKNQIGGEVDVLVRYGEFVILVQAKSKRITLRRGRAILMRSRATSKGPSRIPTSKRLPVAIWSRLARDASTRRAKTSHSPQHHAYSRSLSSAMRFPPPHRFRAACWSGPKAHPRRSSGTSASSIALHVCCPPPSKCSST